MRVVTLILIIVVIGAVAYWQGWLKIGEGGRDVSVSVPAPDAPVSAIYQYADSLFTAGDWLKSVEQYEKALGMDPDYTGAETAYWHVARAYHQVAENGGTPEHWPDAAAAYKKYSRLYPSGKFSSNCQNIMNDPAIFEHL